MKLPKIAMFCALSLMSILPVHAQTIPATAQSSELWVLWREGFEKYEKAESFAANKQYSESMQFYQESQKIFLKIKTMAPDWNKDVIFYRLELCRRRLDSIKKKAGKADEEAKEISRQSTEERFVSEILELKEQLRKTRFELMDAKAEASRNALSEKQVRDLMNEKNDLLKQVATAEVRIENLKAEAAKNDRTEEFNKKLADEKAKLEKAQRQISSLKVDIETLNQRCILYLSRRATLETKLKQSEEKIADFTAKAAKADALLQENENLSKALTQKKADFEEIAGKLKRSDDRILQLEKTIDDLKAGTTQAEAVSEAKLRADLDAEKKNSEYLTNLAAKLKDETLAMKSSMEEKEAEHKKVVVDYVKATEALAKAQAEITILKAEMKDLTGSSGTAKVLAEENEKLKKDIDTIAAKYEDLRKKATDSSAQAAEMLRLKTEIESLKKDYAEAKAQAEKKVAETAPAAAPAATPAAVPAAVPATAGNETELTKLVASLKKDLEELQKKQQEASKQAGVLELEKTDLEKKLQGMVPAADLKTASDKLQKSMDENREMQLKYTTMQANLAETRTALETANRLADDRRKLLESTQGKYTETAKKEIENLTATITELMEGRTQYESAIRSLTADKNQLTEENKELKLSNAAFLAEVADLKKKTDPDPEIIRQNTEILKKARQYEGLYKESSEKNASLEKEKKNLDGLVESMRSEMTVMQSHVDRLRAELADWSDEPMRQDEEKIARKDKAIDELVQEIESLKKESSMLKSELNMSKDEALKYRDMGKKVAENLQTAHAELALLRTKLANAGITLPAKPVRTAGKAEAKEVEEPVKNVSGVKKTADGEIVKVQPEGLKEPVKPVVKAEKTEKVETAEKAAPVEKADEVQAIRKEIATEKVSDEDMARAKEAYEAGLAAEKANDLDTAIISFWRAADANPNDWKIHFALASVYMKRNDPQSASKAYEKAITLGMARDEAFEKNIRESVQKNGEN